MKPPGPTYDPLIEFIRNRAPWFQIGLVERLQGGPGYDVVLRLDGSYSGEPSDDVAAHLATWLRDVLVEARILDTFAEPPEPVEVPVIPAQPEVRCEECNRRLRAETSRERRVGPVCAKWLARREHDNPKEIT